MMDYVSGWCKSKRIINGHTVIITGSNTGIGRETATDLYTRGARIIMACRDVTKAEMAKAEIERDNETSDTKGSLIVEELDLCSLKSVRNFAKRVLEKEDNIQVLINNAGVMMCPRGYTEDGFETHMGSNHIGHMYLTLLLLPRLKRSAPSRIVCLSSMLHEKCDLDMDDLNFEKPLYDAYNAYCRSKAANVLFARGLANELKERNIEGVSTYSVHPGVIKTGIGRHLDKTVLYGATWLFENVLGFFVKSSRCGAQTSIYCAIDESCANETGLYYSDCAVKSPSKQCQSDKKAAELWAVTMEFLITHLRNFDPFGDSDPTFSD